MLPKMKLFLSSLIIMGPFWVAAQHADQDVKQLSQERAVVLNMIDSLENRLTEIDDLLSITSPEDRLAAMQAKYGKNKAKMIAEGKVWPGISYEMAIDSWGEPTDKKTTLLTTGSTEKWNYPEGRYLFFKNGRLETWKD